MKTLGQIAHEARGSWGTFAVAMKWEALHKRQQEELERMAVAVGTAERERIAAEFDGWREEDRLQPAFVARWIRDA